MFLVDLSVVPCLSGKSCGPGRSFEASRRARAGKDLCFLRMRPALYRLSLVYCCANWMCFFPAATTGKRTFRGSGTDMGEEDGTSSRFSCWSSSVTRTTGGTRIDLVRRGPPPTLWKTSRFLLLSFLLNVMFYIKHLSYYLDVLFNL